jgi:zinc protease
MAFPACSLKDKNKYVLSVISLIMSGLGSRLSVRLRDVEALCYSTGCYAYLQYDPGYYAFYIITAPEKLQQAKKAIWEEIERLKNEPVSDEEINRARNQLAGQNIMYQQKYENMAMSMALDELYGVGYEETFKYPEYVNQVSKEDIMKVARKYFVRQKCVIALTLPEGYKEEKQKKQGGR